MVIGVDLDDVLADTVPALIVYHNLKFGTAFTLSDFTSYEWWRIWGGTRDESVKKAFDFLKSDHGKRIPSVAGSQDSILQLAARHALIVITSRQSELAAQTHEWIGTHFPNMFKEVVITNHAQWSLGGISTTKSRVCIEKKVELLIEDNLEYANECAKVGTSVFLFDKPWNRGTSHARVKRIKGWQDVRVNDLSRG